MTSPVAIHQGGRSPPRSNLTLREVRARIVADLRAQHTRSDVERRLAQLGWTTAATELALTDADAIEALR